MHTIITSRAVIIDGNRLLMCRLNKPGRTFYCLPGGKLDVGETIEACMERELVEESGIKPDIGKLLFINQFINASNHRIEFFFQINNPKDYISVDPAKASHGFEIKDFVFADPTDPKYDLKPSFLRDRFAFLVSSIDNFQTEIALST